MQKRLNIKLITFIFSISSLFIKGQSGDADKLLFEKSLQVTTATNREHVDKTANDAFPPTDFNKAILKLQTQLEKKPDNANLNYKLGLCYYFSYDKRHEALPYLQEAMWNMTDDYFYGDKEHAPYAVLYFLAECYLEKGEPDSAIKYLAKYHDRYEETPLSTDLTTMMSLNLKNARMKKPATIARNIGSSVNTPYSETNPVMSSDGTWLFFSSRRPSAKDSAKKMLPDAEIYFMKKEGESWGALRKFPHNSAGDDAPLFISPDGKELYIRRFNKKHFDIYKSELRAEEWSEPVAVSELNSQSHETGLTIAPNDSICYVSSNRNKNGRFDIFSATKQKDGKWGDMQLLKSGINSPYYELTPALSKDGKRLWYCSNGSGQKGIGDFDIFYSDRNNDKTWTEPVNSGLGINSPAADIDFYPVNPTTGVFARLTENNSYDIFISDGTTRFEELATNHADKKPKDVDTTTTNSIANNAKGENTVSERGEGAEINNRKPKNKSGEEDNDNKGAQTTEAPIDITSLRIEELSHSEKLKLIEKVKPHLDIETKEDNMGDTYGTVFFDFNSYYLSRDSKRELNKVVAELKNNSNKKVIVVGHCDTKGDWEANLRVSTMRAKAVYRYLIEKEVSPSRLVYYGKGYISPLETNDEKNRRVTVSLLNN